MTVNDGGAAFPAFFPESKNREGRIVRARDEHFGMSLRDYFAGQALTGLLHTYGPDDAVGVDPLNELSVLAYQYADAMLKARSEKPQS